MHQQLLARINKHGIEVIKQGEINALYNQAYENMVMKRWQEKSKAQ